ncbi:MAG: U32 family peptidase [Firmicutes bacterium]|nr:U32 family peptidase [Bacillota bacterium]
MAQRIELLAPAGNREKAEVAIAFGADAIYVGGKEYSLRASAGNFTLTEMASLVEYAHAAHVKVYVAVNSLLHNPELEGLASYLRSLADLGVDAVIFADPAVYAIAREAAPDLPLHISTQASVTNWRSVQFWEAMGVRRVILARELSLEEIQEIRGKVNVELEAFVHGAMCISYSGRCLLSNYMTGRDANRGECAQACRWRYALMEEKRPGHYYPVEEDEKGTYIMNSKDLNMLAHIPAMAKAGIGSLKIEGRMKSVYYVGMVVKAYRAALDAYHADPHGYQSRQEWLDELDKVSHRPYTTGFYFGPPGPEGQFYVSGGYIRDYDFVGILPESSEGKGRVAVRNRLRQGEKVELVAPTGAPIEFIIEEMWDEDGVAQTEAHANQVIYLDLPAKAPALSMLRREVGQEQA